MVRKMPGRSSRGGSAQIQFNRRIPSDVAARAAGHAVIIEFPALASTPAKTTSSRLGKTHARFSLGTTDARVADQRAALVVAHLEALYDELRRGPQRLTQKQCVALAGEVYWLVVAKFDDDPGTPDRWAAFKVLNREAREGNESTPRISADLREASNTEGRSGLESRFGLLTDWVLSTKALVIDADSRASLLKHVEAAATDAGWRMKRAAQGDYSPDPKAARFPEWSPPAGSSTINDRATELALSVARTGRKGGLSWDALIGAWEKAHAASGGPPTTRREWRARILKFADHAGVSPTNTTDEHVRAWRDKRLADGRSPLTVGDGDLTTIRGVFKHAIRERLLTGPNPAQGVVVVNMGRSAKRMKSFTDDEAATILAAAKLQREPWKRWVPALCALTGSRVATMVNLRACDVKLVDGFHVIEVTAEAGPVKTGDSERQIPIHPALIADGFLDFVATREGKRLFFDERLPRRGLGEYNPGKRWCARLALWVRSLGLVVGREHGKDPNHAWRHWIKTKLRDAGVTDTVSDGITGHAPRSEGGGYGHVSLKAKADALAKIEVPTKKPTTPTLLAAE